MEAPQEIRTLLPSTYGRAIPLLGVHPEGMKPGARAAICPPMLITALLTVAKVWQQPLNGWMDQEHVEANKYTHTMVYYSALN